MITLLRVEEEENRISSKSAELWYEICEYLHCFWGMTVELNQAYCVPRYVSRPTFNLAATATTVPVLLRFAFLA